MSQKWIFTNSFLAQSKSYWSCLTASNPFSMIILRRWVTVQCADDPVLFRYAFVLHRTAEQARQNLRMPINRSYFGVDCSISFAQNNRASCDPSNQHRRWDGRTVVITKIPANVSVADLKAMFVNGHIVKYCPARMAARSSGEKNLLTG